MPVRAPRLRIGQLAERAGVTTKTVRFYEARGLLPPPPRTGAGYRLYDDGDVERLRFVKAAQRLGLGLDDIGEILALRDRGVRPCGYVTALLADHLDAMDQRIGELVRLRAELTDLLARAGDGTDDGSGERFCRILDHATSPAVRR